MMTKNFASWNNLVLATLVFFTSNKALQPFLFSFFENNLFRLKHFKKYLKRNNFKSILFYLKLLNNILFHAFFAKDVNFLLITLICNFMWNWKALVYIHHKWNMWPNISNLDLKMSCHEPYNFLQNSDFTKNWKIHFSSIFSSFGTAKDILRKNLKGNH